jgi:Conserved TM helix
MEAIWENLKTQFASYTPNLLGALTVLVIGWILALIVSAAVKGILARVSVDNRLAKWLAGPDSQKAVPAEDWASRAVFYFLMMFVLVAFFTTLKLNIVTEPITKLIESFTAYLPRLIGAGALILVAWVIALVLKRVVGGALTAVRLDERLGGAQGSTAKPEASITKSLSEAVYWLVFVLFLMPILETLQMKSLLEPLNALFNKAFGYVPNVLAAGFTLLVGWFIARVVHRIVSSFLASLGADSLASRWGFASVLGKQKLSEILGLLLYFLILVPVLVGALNALQLDAITKPASEMLGKIFGLLPSITGAALVLIIAYVIGKVVGGIVTNLLSGLGFNNVLVKLGLSRHALEGNRSPAHVVGTLILVVIMLFATAEASTLLGFVSLKLKIEEFIEVSGHIMMGLFMFGLGLLLAQLIASAISSSDSPNAKRLAFAARMAVTALVGAMSLRQMGLANDIVNLAFGLTLGALALAAGLAFGLGGRDTAGETVKEWKAELKSNRRNEN